MPIDTIRDIPDAVQAAEEAEDEAEKEFGGAVWWRGHARSTWTLVPKLHRLTYRVGPPRTNPENSMVRWFQTKAVSRRTGCPAATEYALWLFLMQHYGLPTRLLDWTESILTALFFAVDPLEEPETDKYPGTLWALNPNALNLAQFGQPSLLLPEKVPNMFAEPFQKPEKPDAGYKIVAITPTEIDPRLMAQLSMFTVHRVDTPIEQLPPLDTARLVWRYAIPLEAKGRIREQLAWLGMRRANLFPDLENLAKEIRAAYIRPDTQEASELA